MTGVSGAGKSTLSALLGERGWRFLGDEFVLIDPDTGNIAPFPRPISLKNEAIAAIEALAAINGKVVRIRMEELRRNAVDADTESPFSAEEAAEPIDGEHALTTNGDDTNDAVAAANVELDAHPADTNVPTDSE